MIKDFFLEIPTRIHFGRGCTADAFEKERATLGNRVLLITTGKPLFETGAVGELIEYLEAVLGRGCATVFSKVSPEPQLAEIREAIKFGRENMVDSVVGFGGGSSIDAAKATALGLGTSYSIDEYYYDGRTPDQNPLPVIAVPTTAGTGSELSGSAVVSDVSTGMKKGIRNRFMYATVAIVDPSFTDSLPPKVTRDSGFDAFAHAVETYMSVKATPLSDILAEQAISKIAKALPRLAEASDDKDARDEMSYASMLMVINIGNVGTLLPHRLQYPVGIKTNTSHGEGLLAVFPSWLEEAYEFNPEKICKVAELLSDRRCTSKNACMDVVSGFMEAIGGKVTLSELGITKEDVDAFAPKITGVLENDPTYTGIESIRCIYENALKK